MEPAARRGTGTRSPASCRERGHDVVAVDLPCDDESAGLGEYADVVNAVGDRTDLVVVAHSLGGFTAPLVCCQEADGTICPVHAHACPR
jgi:pimeloyl-ACP methyl ester carboxylesterase